MNTASDFHHITARLKIPLAPVFLSKPSRNGHRSQDSLPINPDSRSIDKDPFESLSVHPTSNGPLEAVNQSIASLLMKYIPSLGSVLVAYLQPPAFILHDKHGRPFRRVANKAHRLSIPTIPGNGWGVIDVEVKLMGWRPTIGQKLIGRPTLSSPSHLSLVIYQTFNATIHENHLKSAGYYYDSNAQVPPSWIHSENDAPENPSRSRADSTFDEHKGCGSWVDANGKAVGGDDGTISFTVISLTVANNMISVVGSLLDDPFSVQSVIPPSQSILKSIPSKIPAQSLDKSFSSGEEEEEEEEEVKARSSSQQKPSKLNSLKSPPPIKSSKEKTKQSKRISQTSNNNQSLAEISIDINTNENPIQKTKSGRTVKTSTSKNDKKLKRSAPPHDDHQNNSPNASMNHVVNTPSKRRQSSTKPKISSTPSKKKIKIK